MDGSAHVLAPHFLPIPERTDCSIIHRFMGHLASHLLRPSFRSFHDDANPSHGISLIFPLLFIVDLVLPISSKRSQAKVGGRRGRG